ncbi:MAG TPA: hypothetical protein VIK15_06290 [Candidatus Anoxymicrobiaceae bacterium]
MNQKKFDIGESLRFGWETFKSNIGFLILIVLIFWVVEGIFSVPTYAVRNQAVILIFNILGFVIAVFVAIATIKISLRFLAGGPGDFTDLYEGYPRFLDMLVGQILYALIVIAGLILLIVPGIIWGLKYQFYPYLIIDKDMGSVDAIKRSGQITMHQKGHLFLFWLAVVGINILGAVACGIGLFITIPLTFLAHAHIYRRLEYASEVAQPVAPTPDPAQPVPPAPEG